MSNFNETEHPRDSDGKFTNGNGTSERDKTVAAIRKYSDDPGRDMEYSNLPSARQIANSIPQSAWDNKSTATNRINVGEIISPIYDDMVLSNGRNVKDIVTRVVEMPLAGSAGADHIEQHKERRGMVDKYIGFMSDIINDPDYVFEDKVHENTLQIEKQIDKHTIMTVSLNYNNPDYTNTVITMLNLSEKSFAKMKRNYERFGKVLYKRHNT